MIYTKVKQAYKYINTSIQVLHTYTNSLMFNNTNIVVLCLCRALGAGGTGVWYKLILFWTVKNILINTNFYYLISIKKHTNLILVTY